MLETGFRENQPGSWRCGNTTLHWFGPGAKNDIGKLAHLMRERWRQRQFQRFCEHKRREAVEIRLTTGATEYDDWVVAKARLLFRNATAEERGVMLGASFSPAAYDKIHRREAPLDPVFLHECPWCNCKLIPDWQHVAWQCEGFQANRPARPEAIWARRFGWPNDANSSACVSWRSQGHRACTLWLLTAFEVSSSSCLRCVVVLEAAHTTTRTRHDLPCTICATSYGVHGPQPQPEVRNA